MTLDLSSARVTAQSMMTTTCRITRDTEGVLDDTVNPTTLVITPPVNDSSVVYEGPCIVSQRLREFRTDEGERTAFRRVWQIRLPFDPPAEDRGPSWPPLTRDTWEGLTSDNPQLVGHRMRIFDVNLNSLVTTRRMLAEDAAGPSPR